MITMEYKMREDGTAGVPSSRFLLVAKFCCVIFYNLASISCHAIESRIRQFSGFAAVLADIQRIQRCLSVCHPGIKCVLKSINRQVWINTFYRLPIKGRQVRHSSSIIANKIFSKALEPCDAINAIGIDTAEIRQTALIGRQTIAE